MADVLNEPADVLSSFRIAHAVTMATHHGDAEEAHCVTRSQRPLRSRGLTTLAAWRIPFDAERFVFPSAFSLLISRRPALFPPLKKKRNTI